MAFPVPGMGPAVTPFGAGVPGAGIAPFGAGFGYPGAMPAGAAVPGCATGCQPIYGPIGNICHQVTPVQQMIPSTSISPISNWFPPEMAYGAPVTTGFGPTMPVPAPAGAPAFPIPAPGPAPMPAPGPFPFGAGINPWGAGLMSPMYNKGITPWGAGVGPDGII